MAYHNETGKLGEQIAEQYLLDKGWTIAARNYRSGKGEIDLIAWASPELLVFIEVKTRSSEAFGPPEISVDEKKADLMARLANHYMAAIGYEWAIRFDIIAVTLSKKGAGTTEVRHLEDVFF